MAITFITTAPYLGTYTPLADFQSQTPESLSDTEVLHYSSPAEIAFRPSTATQFQSPSIHVYVTSKSPSSLVVVADVQNRDVMVRGGV
jgi:hypothetical protein